MKQKQIKTKGGIAKPLGDNYFLMRGATHEQGGIDIGNNIEVENGEIVKLNPKSIKVLSNAPIMKGISPAQMALGGLNDGTFEKRFNAGFNYQEKFKDINGLKDDGTKAKFGTEKADKQQVEDVVRTSGGMTGELKDFFMKGFPWIDFPKVKRAYDTWKVMKGDKTKVAPSNENYTGVAMEGKGLLTDNGLGFVSQDDLKQTLGYDPVDFVDTFITGETPFEKEGVIKKENAEEKRIFTKKLQRMQEPNVNVFQTHKDTLDARTLALLEDRLANGKYTYFNSNTTYPESPFNIGDSGMIYDGNNSTTIRVVLPDGRVFYKTNDIFDTDPKEWNYKVVPFAKKGLKFIHDNTKPFMMTTPWYNGKADTNTWRRMEEMFGITIDQNGTLHNYGDSNGKKWDVEEALDWINAHPYEVDYQGAKDKEYNKLGGTHKMKVKDKVIPSTGKVKKALFGTNEPIKLNGTTVISDGNVLPDLNWIGLKTVNPNIIVPKIDNNGIYNLGEFPKIQMPKLLDAPTGTIATPNGWKKVNNTYLPDQSINQDKVSFLEANPNFLGDVIGAGANLIGNAVVAGINANTLKNLKYRPKPTPLQSAKLQTDVNYNPQYRAIEDSLARHKDYVNKNTASSATAGNRIRLAELEALKNSQLLRTNEINLESELLNKDAINAQTVVNSNITRNDEWRAGKTEFENAIKEGKAENANMAIQNSIDALMAPVNNLAQWRNTMANVAAFSAANPNVSPELMDYYGLPYALYLKQKRESKNKNNRRG